MKVINVGDVVQMVERLFSMREVRGSIPCISTFHFSPVTCYIHFLFTSYPFSLLSLSSSYYSISQLNLSLLKTSYNLKLIYM